MTTALKTRIDPAWVYDHPARGGPGVLRLDRNEGLLPSPGALADLAEADPELLRRYPDVSELTALLAARWNVAPGRVIVTAGADEAIDRICRAFLARGRTLLLPEPSFEMLDRYAALAGGELVRVPWPADVFPTDEFLERVDGRTAVIAIVSPNNPTGGVATLADVRRLAVQAHEALILLDHAYVEYADDDLTAAVLDLPNVVVTRTLSKAWGLAGCRVGYAIGSPDVIAVLHAAGGPYPVAAPSISLAVHQLESGALLLFAFFMISDPKTTPRARRGRVLFAALVACGAAAVQFLMYRTNGLLWSLVVCSLAVPLIDRLLPGPRYEWSRPVARYPKHPEGDSHATPIGSRRGVPEHGALADSRA